MLGAFSVIGLIGFIATFVLIMHAGAGCRRCNGL